LTQGGEGNGLFPLLVRRPRLLWVYLYSSGLARLYRVGGSPLQKARLACRAFLNFMRT